MSARPTTFRAASSKANLSLCVFTESTAEANRFPQSGWLERSLDDLADMIRLVSVPERAVDDATTTLQEGIGGAAKVLDEMKEIRPRITTAIARFLCMLNVRQTRRVTCAIVADGSVFHERIAGDERVGQCQASGVGMRRKCIGPLPPQTDRVALAYL